MTIRLADSLPAHVLQKLEASALEERTSALEERRWAPAERLRQTDLELDAGWGECQLKEPRVAELVENALLHFDQDRYRLVAWVVMPNHVHVVLQCDPQWMLTRIVHSWKWNTAVTINAVLGRKGRLWQPEYFDRRIRDDEQLGRCITYVEMNPVKAGLCALPQEWRFGSARRRVSGS